jgi:hypothetical protein
MSTTALQFSISLINEDLKVRIVKTDTEHTFGTGNTLIILFDGKINGNIASLLLTPQQIVDFNLQLPVDITVFALTDGRASILPDDFYRVQIQEKNGNNLVVTSEMTTLGSYSYIQKMINDKIVRTERIIGIVEKTNIHRLFIHMRVLLLYGTNPPISKENTIVNRIKYLKMI